jgi:hypothetical protein
MLKTSLATFAAMDAIAHAMFSSGPVSMGSVGISLVLTAVGLYPIVNGWAENLFRGDEDRGTDGSA